MTRPSTSRWLLGLSLAVTLALAPESVALAAWSASAPGSGAGAAAVMPNGTAPTVSVIGTSVTVTWGTADLSSGTAVAGYVIRRYNSTTLALAAIGASCTGTITTTTCTESAVPAGTWVYTDTPAQVNWTGGASPNSAVATVP